jgi:hypothetical protein
LSKIKVERIATLGGAVKRIWLSQNVLQFGLAEVQRLELKSNMSSTG